MEMSSELVHDIRNTIASIKAYIQIVRRRAEKKDMVEELEYLIKIDEKTDELITLINNPNTKTK
jgi:signal transduction histidine kinase